MEKKKGGLKSFLTTSAVILFSVVLFIARILINSIPKEDFPWVTPIVIGLIFVASVGYLIYAIFFSKDSFYRKKYLEKKTGKEKEKTLRELFEEEKEDAPHKKKTNWILIVLAITIILSLIGGAFYWFEYRPTQIRKDCSWTEYRPGKWREARESEYEKCLRRNGLLE